METEQINELVTAFAEAAQKHYTTSNDGDFRKANKAAEKLHKLFQEIKTHGDEGRLALLKQVESADLAVASMAATYSLKFRTEVSQATLKRVSREPGLLGFQAQQALKRWQAGEWQLE